MSIKGACMCFSLLLFIAGGCSGSAISDSRKAEIEAERTLQKLRSDEAMAKLLAESAPRGVALRAMLKEKGVPKIKDMAVGDLVYVHQEVGIRNPSASDIKTVMSIAGKIDGEYDMRLVTVRHAVHLFGNNYRLGVEYKTAVFFAYELIPAYRVEFAADETGKHFVAHSVYYKWTR